MLQDDHIPIGMNRTEHYGCESHTFFIALGINKHILHRNVCILYRNVYTVKVRMSDSGM